MTSCGGANPIVLIEDVQPNIVMRLQEEKPIRLLPGDKLNVSVHSRDKELVEMFNINGGGGSGTGMSTNANSNAYTVDENGQIEMPIIGSINVKGLTRIELQNLVKYKLLASKLVRDPIVSVEFLEMNYFTLGEIGYSAHPIKRDKVTLLEAIAESGGISTEGMHTKVLVLRSLDGKQTPYQVDVTKVSDLYSSPVYYIQQNDVIYVEPTETKKNNTSIYGNSFRTPTFWMGLFNFALSLILLISK